jgi:N-acetylglucosamine-6-phosphate deacetylase
MLIKIMGIERIIIISDAVSAMGLPVGGRHISGGLEVTVKEGYCTLDDGTIAGSTTCLFQGIKNVIKFGFTPKEAFVMGSENPARHMGLNKGKIEAGYDADFLITDEEMNLCLAVVGGRM